MSQSDTRTLCVDTVPVRRDKTQRPYRPVYARLSEDTLRMLGVTTVRMLDRS